MILNKMIYKEIKRKIAKTLLTSVFLGGLALYISNSLKEDDYAELKDNITFYFSNETYLSYINKKFNSDEVQLSFFNPPVDFSEMLPSRGVHYKSNYDLPNTDQNSWTLEERLQVGGLKDPIRTNRESQDYPLYNKKFQKIVKAYYKKLDSLKIN